MCVKWYLTMPDIDRMDKKTQSSFMLLTRNSLRSRDRSRWNMKGWEKISHANRNQKRTGVDVLISDKIDWESKTVARNKGVMY